MTVCILQFFAIFQARCISSGYEGAPLDSFVIACLSNFAFGVSWRLFNLLYSKRFVSNLDCTKAYWFDSPVQYPTSYLKALLHALNCSWKPQTCAALKLVGAEAPRAEWIEVVLVMTVMGLQRSQRLLGAALVGGRGEGLAVARGKQWIFVLLHVKVVLTSNGDFGTTLNVLP